MKLFLALVCFAVAACASYAPGDRYMVPVDTVDAKTGAKGQRMALAAALNSDVEGPEEITITAGNGYSIVHKRPEMTVGAGQSETTQVLAADKKTLLTSTRAVIPRKGVSSVWAGWGNFLVKGGEGFGKAATPIVTGIAIPYAGQAVGIGAAAVKP